MRYKNQYGNKFPPAFSVIKKMPPLYHTLPGEDFDWEKSEVMKWALSQPQIGNKIMNEVRKYATYDADTGKWTGIEWRG